MIRLHTAFLTFIAMTIALLAGIAPAQARDGSLTWSGRVDDSVEIVISGRTVRYRAVNGNKPTETKYNFSESLPLKNVNVRLSRRSGRGSLQIVERPNYGNGFSTVVKIVDSQSGPDRYSFDLRWDDNGGSDRPNRPGRAEIRWSGRIDSIEEIRIRRQRITWKRVDGNEATEVRHDVGRGLPLKPVRCRIEKRRGRGSVSVISQPNEGNNYTATIRIQDTGSGSDIYDIVIRW